MMALRLPILPCLIAGSFVTSLAVLVSWGPPGRAMSRPGGTMTLSAAAPAAPRTAARADRPAPPPDNAAGPLVQTLERDDEPPELVVDRDHATDVASAQVEPEDVAGAVFADGGFRKAIAERLADPDPVVRRAAADLYQEFLLAAGEPFSGGGESVRSGSRGAASERDGNVDTVTGPSRTRNAPPLASPAAR